MLACSRGSTSASIVERVTAGTISLLLALSAIELVSDSLVAAVGAGAVSILALRLALRGSCGSGSECSPADTEELDGPANDDFAHPVRKDMS